MGPIGPLHDAEVALSQVKAAVTSIRAAYFMENWGSALYALDKGVLPTFLAAGHAIAMVATADVGTISAKALLEGGKGYSVIELAGPRDYTPGAVAPALARITGKPVAVQRAAGEPMGPA